MKRWLNRQSLSRQWLGRVACILLLTVACSVGLASAAPTPANAVDVANEYCPVNPDEPIDSDISVKYEGKEVFFCCNRCRKKFLANPTAYTANLPQLRDEHDHGHAEEAPSAHDHMEHGDAEDTHDHARDHGAPIGLKKLGQFIGKFHPLIVHFPIALIISAVLAELLSWWRKSTLFAEVGRFAVILGAISAVAAAPLGWLTAAFSSYPADMQRVLFLHRWLGVSVVVSSLATAILAQRARGYASGRSRKAYRLALLISGVLVGLAGHFGASLIYGTDYFTW